MYRIFLVSGATTTRTISVSISQNEEQFVELMNKKAQELNLKDIHFTNTVELDDEDHYSTINDMAIILKDTLRK